MVVQRLYLLGVFDSCGEVLMRLGLASTCFNCVSLKPCHVLSFGLVLLLTCPVLFSQGSSGRILGGVTDQSGGNVAGATVTITDVQRGIPRTLITDNDGEYIALDLLPGIYMVR